MHGLEALRKVRQVAEDHALDALSAARRDLEALHAEESAVAGRARAAKDALREIEQGAGGAREAIMHRRYVSALRSRVARCRARALQAKEVVDGRAKVYEEARHRREAVGEVIARRRLAAEKAKARREERDLNDLARARWARDV